MSPDWRRPSRCEAHACAEVRVGATDVLVRSTNYPDNIAVFTIAEWSALTEAIRAGEFKVGDG